MAGELPTRDGVKVVRPESIPTPVGKSERRELRTVNSKTFLHTEKAADGKEIRTCHATLGAVCYRDDDGQLRSIDTTIRDLDGEVGVDWAPYKFRLHSEGIGFDFFSRDGGWVGITLSGIGGERFDQDTPLKPEIVDNTITFRDVRPGCDIVFKCLNQRVKTLRILRDANAPRTFDWTVASDKPELIDSTLTGTDAAGNQLELLSEVDGDLIRETWGGRLLSGIDVLRAIEHKGGEPVYPVEIDPTANQSIVDNIDNGHETNTSNWGYYNDSSGSMAFGEFVGNDYRPSVRFSGINIEQGVTVTSETLTLDCHTAGSTTGTIYGLAADNVAQYVQNSVLPSMTPQTTASVAVPSLSSTGVKTYDTTAIGQEIFNRSGWASGNARAFTILKSNTNLSRYHNNLSGGTAPGLSITYTAAAGGTAGNLLLLGCG